VGIADFNRGAYWEAHHGWESGWTMLEPGSKLWIQILIQSCGVFVHLEKGRLDPALSLARSALQKWRELDLQGGFESLTPRVEVPGLRNVLEALLVESAGLADESEPTNLKWVDWEARIRALLAEGVGFDVIR